MTKSRAAASTGTSEELKPIVKPVVVDKLAGIVPKIAGLTDGSYVDRCLSKCEEHAKEGRCRREYLDGRNYKASFKYSLPDDGGLLVQIGARRRTQHGVMRFEGNPNKWSARGRAAVIAILDELTFGNRTEVMAHALVNRFEPAVDVVNTNLRSTYVSYKHHQHQTMVSKQIRSGCSVPETITFGSFTSDFTAVAYDKDREELAATLKRLARTNGGRVEGFEQCVRSVEQQLDRPATLRFETRCKKLRGVHPSLLTGLENRFARFRVWDVSMLDAVDEPLRTLFLCTCRDLGLRRALKTMEGHPTHGRLRDLVQHQASWWRPEHYWTDAVDALKRTGIFPGSAFEPPEKGVL